MCAPEMARRWKRPVFCRAGVVSGVRRPRPPRRSVSRDRSFGRQAARLSCWRGERPFDPSPGTRCRRREIGRRRSEDAGTAAGPFDEERAFGRGQAMEELGLEIHPGERIVEIPEFARRDDLGRDLETSPAAKPRRRAGTRPTGGRRRGDFRRSRFSVPPISTDSTRRKRKSRSAPGAGARVRDPAKSRVDRFRERSQGVALRSGGRTGRTRPRRGGWSRREGRRKRPRVRFSRYRIQAAARAAPGRRSRPRRARARESPRPMPPARATPGKKREERAQSK